MNGIIRQGDVVLIPCALPKGTTLKKRKRGEGIIVAAGEATGHHHRVRTPGARERTKGNVRFLTVGKRKAVLTHEEHDPLELAAGTTYRIGNQREYEPPKAVTARPTVRRVFD